jgi:hypothetical protein
MHFTIDKLKFKYIVLFISLFFLLLIFVINPNGNFPLNDDWRYASLVKSLQENGVFEIKCNFAPTVIFQILWGYLFCIPFGFSFITLRISTLVLSWGGIAIFAKLLYSITQSAKKTLLVTILLLLNPLYLNLSFSFMTDIPFLSLSILSFFWIYKYINTNKVTFLILSITTSFLSFLIRQPGILFPILLGLVIFQKKKSLKEKILIPFLLTSLSVAFYLLFEKLKEPLGLSNAYVKVDSELIEKVTISLPSSLFEIFKQMLKTIIVCGLFLLPIFYLLPHKKQNIKFHLLVIGGNVVVLIFLIGINKIFPFGGNYIYNAGLGPALLRDVYILNLNNLPSLPKFIYILLTFIGQLAGTYTLINVFQFYNKKMEPFALFLLLVTIAYIILMSITSSYDRYLLLPFTILIILISPIISRPKKHIKTTYFSCILTFIIITFYSVAGTHDYLTWNRAKQSAFTDLSKENIDIKRMDAGQEINSWLLASPGNISTPGKSWWAVNDDEFIIAFGPIKGYSVYSYKSYYSYLYFQKRKIFVLQRVNLKL